MIKKSHLERLFVGGVFWYLYFRLIRLKQGGVHLKAALFNWLQDEILQTTYTTPKKQIFSKIDLEGGKLSNSDFR